MFSGIVETLGHVTQRVALEGATRFTIEAADIVESLRPGDSVAVDGACLTVESVDGPQFAVTAVATTLQRTIANSYAAGCRVNLERALRVGDRLDGHFVQGHVDGIGTLLDIHRDGADVRLKFGVPADVARATIEKGSITLNGVSLTVAGGPGGEGGVEVTIAAIPFTLEHTNLGQLAPGDVVNVEGDLIGKYVGRMVALGQSPASEPANQQGR